MRPRPLPSAIVAFLAAVVTMGVATGAMADGSITADDDAYSTVHDQTLVVAAPGVMANDTDTFGNPQVALDQDVGHGTLTLDTDGSVSYTPDAGYMGPDSFMYHVTDVDGSNVPGSSNVATVTISVTNADPVSTDDSYSVTQGQTLTENTATGVLSNDTDLDGDTLTADLLIDVSHGNLTLNADGSFTYTPDTPFFGMDHFTYQADDGHGGTSDPATVTISVSAIGNSPPTAVNDSYSVQQGGTLTKNPASGVLSNDTDLDGDTLTASLLIDVSHGTLTLNGDGSFTYTPNTQFFGMDHFTYQADDGHGGTSDPATVTISVSATGNSPPAATDDSYSVTQGQTLTKNAASGVLANDSDPDGDTLTAGLLIDVSHGTLTLNGDGSFTYTPNTQFFGMDHFTYQADDGVGGTSDPATVTISVSAIGNSPPTAVDDSYSVTQGQMLTKIAAIGVLSNDTDLDGDTLTADLLTDVSHGNLTLNADGSFTYTPNTPFFGTDHFTYQADDGHGGTSDPATVTISVNADRRPAAADDNFASPPVTRGHKLSIAAPGVLANDTDPDGDPLTAHPAAKPAKGTLTLNPDGSFTYVPNTGVCNASDTFTYRASDGILASAPATVTVRTSTPLRSTQMRFRVLDHAVRVGQFVTLTAYVRAFSPGSFVRFFARRPGAAPTLLGSRPLKTHVAKLRIQPARNAWYSAISDDDCFKAIRSGPHHVAVEAIGGGHMIGLKGRGAPTYRGFVHPSQPDGVVTFIWQQLSGRRWIHYLDGGVSLDSHGHVGVTLTSGVVRGVHYRVTLRWNGKGGNVPGHAPWTYFIG